ncbi:signal peptidase I [Aeromicrobium duanguangcaii]|uniref:Signal peptidase I n=1 Tax=Aeromicrobium duanguangcaii TaxID=2968086 RepID=A0ABY5KIX5_9ACTN|nr:signal peptidase I [Aeromicrobium duanguangcaii]MCD9153088.1 signal peptidase I [Aeromicrobium duanguangcaii]MCL3836917.1 signal peptidase I [Aeromicrobium duanguangcaii]UUI69810.1 signal peptidase I [Aeromicrobium duanguangcaii]
MTTPTIERTHRTVLRRSGQVFAWVVILVATSAVAVGVLIPRIAGATPYTILTGSMEPNLPPGTLVVVKPKPAEDIGIGSVITYQLRSGDPTVVTHRVTSVGHGSDGELSFITKGDANAAEDLEPVRPVQVKGVLWYSVPKLGWLGNTIDQDQRDAAVYLVVGGLGLYAAWMFGGALRERRGLRRARRDS